MSFPRYERYRESGKEWLGRVPAHWDVTPLKYVASLKGRLGWQGLRADEYTEDGPFLVTSEHFVNEAIDWSRCYHVSPERYALAPEIQLCANDLLIMKDGAAMGKLAYVESVPGPACLNSHLLLFRPRNGRFASRFLFYILGGPSFKSYMARERTGTTFFGISQESIGAFSVALPPIDEQCLILKFLSSEISKIDALISEQQRLISLLKEKRQAVISDAVTKGLNPTTPMKASGIDWLGQVPAHWDVKRLKHVGEAIIGLTYAPTDIVEDEEGLLVLRSSNVQEGRIVFDDNVYVSKVIPEKLIVRRGDILICSRNGSRDLIGKNAMITADTEGFAFGAFMTVFRSEINSYLFWVFNSALFEHQSGAFLTSTINQLTIGTLYGFEVPIPPPEERNEIVMFLGREIAKLEELTAEAEAGISLLQERRTALISAAVTGKIDVRGLVGAHLEGVAAE
jgi:type I restriction enzyme, S subunit